MDHADFDALVARLEEDARRDVAAVMRRARMHVAIGYAYILAVLGIVLALGVTIATLDLPGESESLRFAALLIFAFALVILHALRVRVPRPEGFWVGIAQARPLFERIDVIRVRVQAPFPDGVVLTREFNASVAEAPRFGPFGRPLRYLELGIPLLSALTAAQVDAVLAHEFAHFSAGHTGHGFRFYRAGRSWTRVMEHMEGTGAWALPLFRRFFGWFIPRLSAYGLVIARRHEYEADALAARATSPEDLAGALVALQSRERHVSVDWPRQMWLDAGARSTVPDRAWSELPAMIRSLDVRPRRRAYIGTALRAPARPGDSHPSLRERLLALGVGRESDGMQELIDRADAILGPLEHSALDALVPELAPRLLASLDEEWSDAAEDAWQAQHAQARTLRRRLDRLGDTEREEGELTPEESRERLDLLMKLDGPTASKATALRVLASTPNDTLALSTIGEALLDEGDPAGVPYLVRAIALDIDSTPMLSEFLAEFHETRRDEAGMLEVARLVDAYEQSVREGTEERQSVRPEDVLERIELPDELVDAIRSACMRSNWAASVLITRKRVRHRTAAPFLIVLIRRTTFGRASTHPQHELASDFMESISEPMPPYLLLLDDTEHTWLVTRLRDQGLAVEIRA
jgi:Zn-dependent protease with chaperone function